MASIRKRVYRGKHGETSHWEVRWQNRNGKSSSKSFPTKKEASKYAASLDSQTGRVPVSAARNLLVGDLWARIYARRVSQGVKPTTLRVLDQAWKRICRTEIPMRRVSKLSSDEVQESVSGLANFAGKKSLQVLSEIYREAVDLGFDGSDWTEGVKIRVDPPRVRTYLDFEKLDRFVSSLKTDRDRDTVLILALTGLRVGELAALRVIDWDASSNRLSVRQNASFVGGSVAIHTTKTKRSERSIPVTASISKILDQATIDKEPYDFLWTSPNGQIWRPGNFRKRSGWKQAVADLGLENLRLHDLRHTYASLARVTNIDLATLSRVMGHSSIKVTIDLYGGIYDRELDSLATNLEAQFLASRSSN